ncbi:MAG: NAD-dependent epimerase/dehydratase family protein, partial [Armatimonadetes bacterium]|nr:NAD-dependent epimerase/dehydratase family protein [Armatimonadota bacterium]
MALGGDNSVVVIDNLLSAERFNLSLPTGHPHLTSPHGPPLAPPIRGGEIKEESTWGEEIGVEPLRGVEIGGGNLAAAEGKSHVGRGDQGDEYREGDGRSYAFKFIEGSIADDAILALVQDEFDYIFHLATYHGNQSSIANPLADHENNLITTLKLYEHVKGFKKLKKVVYAASGCTLAAH